MHDPPYVIVAGGIASGKTTLTSGLAPLLGLEAYLEVPASNPFLADFYRDSPRWAFASQLWFLLATLRQQETICARGGVQDHSAYENVHVFGPLLCQRRVLEPRELHALEATFRFGERGLRGPDLIVLLISDPTELKRRVESRGRDYEMTISIDYLAALEDGRRRFFESWNRSPILAVDTARFDFRTNAGLQQVARLIKAELAVPAGA